MSSACRKPRRTLNASLAPGSWGLRASGEPLLDGFRTLFGTDIAKALALVAITGLIASFHAIIFAFGRQIYSLSRAGYFPRFLSVTHGRHHTPQLALLAGSLVGLGVMLFIWTVYGQEKGGAFIGAALLNMAVFGAMISYVMQALSFILLRIRLPDIELVLVIGRYAQAWHLGPKAAADLTATVADWRIMFAGERRPRVLPLPHPSWRNNGWLRKNPWFEAELVPVLRAQVARLVG